MMMPYVKFDGKKLNIDNWILSTYWGAESGDLLGYLGWEVLMESLRPIGSLAVNDRGLLELHTGGLIYTGDVVIKKAILDLETNKYQYLAKHEEEVNWQLEAEMTWVEAHEVCLAD